MANLNRSIIISRIPEEKNRNLFLKITDYVYDSEKIGINCIFNNKEYQLELLDEVLDTEEHPTAFGRRYFRIDDNIFFLDEASDTSGAF